MPAATESARADDRVVGGAEVLLVEDETTLASAISFGLERAGLVVRCAGDGQRAIDELRLRPVNLVLLDLMLPILDGYHVCRFIRRQSSVPILVISACGAETDKLRAFEAGADDYLVKPFGMRELLARVQALLRRGAAGNAPSTSQPLSIGDLLVWPAQRRVERNGELIDLRPRELDLLLYLAHEPGVVFSRGELLERVWGYSPGAETRTVDVHVRMLRSHIEPDPARPRLVLTVRGVGYRLARTDPMQVASTPRT